MPTFHPAPVQLFHFTIVVILRLQSWSCFAATFCSLTLSSIIGTKGLISLNLCCALVLFTLRFVAPEQKLFYGQYFATWLCWACNWNQGLHFAKFFSCPGLVYNVFCCSRADVVLPIFVSWLCRVCIRTRGLIWLNFSHLGVIYNVFCGSRAEVVLRPILVTWLYRACIGSRAKFR